MQQFQRPVGVPVRATGMGSIRWLRLKSRYPYQVVQLDCCDSMVDTRYDLHCDGSSVDVIGVETIAKPGDACGDLVKLNAFFSAICTQLSQPSHSTYVFLIVMIGKGCKIAACG